ncbi:unnamed protein product [Allacma fusca]|uniref:Suppressor of cytokine signaling 6 n=1 Tax=Allacma fusca TaxID=39272 RepID=A0A8J2LL32_9HEXA|nr:unnamed protein product [Allacma fusca]
MKSTHKEMERKLSGASAKLRSLKELLSSTISLSQSQGTSASGSSSGNIIVKQRTQNSISLFNLKDTVAISNGPHSSQTCGRPISMTVSNLENCGFNSGESKSVSMYGLVDVADRSPRSLQASLQSSSNSKNPAVRLFYTIRSKFRKHRRDRNKILDSKSVDFGPFLSERSRISTVSSDRNGRYQLKSSQSADNIDNFASPIGYRNECENYEGMSVTPVNDQPEGSADEERRELERNRDIVPDVPKTKCLTRELCDLLHYGWYWGGLSKEEAEEKLKGQPDGAFVVRDSSSDHYLLSLSFNSNGRTLHTRIEYRNGEFRFYSSEADSFPTVAELIEHCIAYSEAGIFCYSKSRRSDHPSYPVRLTKPISRFTEVKSLLYLSRFVIRKHVRVDLIPQLPLPPTLIDFIGERYI